jgi:hypothetical protein
MKPVFLQFKAEVRYWEDATVNAIEDTNGIKILFREGDAWMPVIRLEDGEILNWPQCREADMHYKVCDAGQYWLLNEKMERIAKWRGSYVPKEYLCQDDQGYGDYIIFKVAPDGKIKDWKNPEFDSERWENIAPEIDENTTLHADKVARLQMQNAELKATNETLREALQDVTNVADQYCIAKSVLENNIIFKYIGAAKKVLQETKTVL